MDALVGAPLRRCLLAVVWRGLTYRRVVVFCCVWGAAAMPAPVADFPLLDLLAAPESAWYFIASLALYLMHRFGQDLLLWGILGMAWLMAEKELGDRIDEVEHVAGGGRCWSSRSSCW